ncbi:hypothetical protein KK087_02815 [Curtobacterium flaccumfaciens pv. flaccumfaciens]|nr:hypothetical protein [Curtobacterium flaccumfaciens pv. flaccumfaciens]
MPNASTPNENSPIRPSSTTRPESLVSTVAENPIDPKSQKACSSTGASSEPVSRRATYSVDPNDAANTTWTSVGPIPAPASALSRCSSPNSAHDRAHTHISGSRRRSPTSRVPRAISSSKTPTNSTPTASSRK